MRRPNECTPEERLAVTGALGRIFMIMSRPEEDGDRAEFERCRKIILDIVGDFDFDVPGAPRPGWNFGRGTTGGTE